MRDEDPSISHCCCYRTRILASCEVKIGEKGNKEPSQYRAVKLYDCIQSSGTRDEGWRGAYGEAEKGEG